MMACGLPYHDERGDVQDCEPESLCRRCLLGIVREQAEELARRPWAGSCVWVSLDSDIDTRIWSTGCKQEWVFHAGSPQENGVKFCPHCGAEAEIEMPKDG